MKQTTPLLPLFKKFINESESGKRRKKDGGKITKGSLKSYGHVLKNLIDFSSTCKIELRICDCQKLTKREYISEKNYWKRFYRNFTNFMYKRDCYDNYVGSTIKHIRTFFNYLKNEKNLNTGDFHSFFYVRKQEVDILVLSPDELKFFIHDKEFEKCLTVNERRIKDIFVFGCTTGLRYSDVFSLTNKNFFLQDGNYYLKVRSQKTKTFTSIRLPDYAIAIYQKYLPESNKTPVFRPITLLNFNKNLKRLGLKAHLTKPINVVKERLGKPITILDNSKNFRFCDKMSSHMMRRTAITTMLILGMPEHLVRCVSGHSSNSSSFYRYVHYAQSYLDQEIEKFHKQLEVYET